MNDELLTKEELCKLLKISRPTLDRWRKQGLPYIKTGRLVRFDRNEVMEWIKKNRKN